MQPTLERALAPPQLDGKLDLSIAADAFPLISGILAQHPDICLIRSRSRVNDSCLINAPDLIKRVLIDNHRNYVKGTGFERVKLLLGNGIIVSDGELWKKQRRMVQPAFHRDMLRSLTGIMRNETELLLERLIKAARSAEPIDLSETMSRFALAVILRCLFGDDLAVMCDTQGGNPFAIFTEHQQRDLNLARRFRALISTMQGLIETRRQCQTEHHDMLAVLMKSHDLEGRPMEDRALVDELMTLIVAGHETSALTLTWMWYLLGKHSVAQASLQREVDALPGAAGTAPDYDTASELGYCKQVMFEALRLYPPVWLYTRKALADDLLGGYKIAAGTDIFISPYYLHRRSDTWPNPEHFDPDRFTDAAVDARHRVAFIPFSAGPRKCIGDVFAILEMQIHMGTLARVLSMRPVDVAEPELEPAINLRNKNPIFMQVAMR